MKTTKSLSRWASLFACGGLVCTGFAIGCADPLPPDPRSDEVTMDNPGLDSESETEVEMERIDDLSTDLDEAVADNTPSETSFQGVVTEVQATALTLRRPGDEPQTFAVDPSVIVSRNGENASGSTPLDSVNVGQRVELAAEREDVENQNTIYVVKKITVLGEGETEENNKEDQPAAPAEQKPEANQPESNESATDAVQNNESTNGESGDGSSENNSADDTEANAPANNEQAGEKQTSGNE